MNMFLSKFLILIFLISSSLFASQKEANNIAQISAISLYNIDKVSLQATIKAYFKNNPNIMALKITESLSKETYISIYRDKDKIISTKILPKDVKIFEFYKTIARYEGENVGKVYAYFKKIEKNIQLNSQEISWIRKNPIISIAVVKNYKPYDMIDENNKLIGFHSDITNLINKNLSSNIKLIPFNSWNDAYTSASKGEIHGIFSLSWSKQREEKYFDYSPTYHFTPYHLLVKKDNQNITTLESLRGKKIAIENKTIFSEVVEQRVPKSKIILVNQTDDTFKSVSKGETEATISASLDEVILEKYNLKVASEFYHKSSELYIGTSKKFPIVSSILTKGLNSISLNEMANLRKKWFEDFYNKLSTKNIINESPFTLKEQEWINNNPIIKVAFMNYWPKDNKGDNINSDLLKLLNHYSNLHFVPIKYNNWGAGYKDAVKGEVIHGILNLSWTKEREKNFFNYTKAYNLIPNYLIVKKDNTDIKNIKDLKNRKVYLRKGSVSNKTIKNKAPTAKIIHIKDESILYETFGLANDADAILDYILDEKKIEKNNLKIIETFYDKYSQVAFGISKKHPTLYTIVEKIYKKIPKNELLKLQKKDYSKKVSEEAQKLNLTKNEINWLKNHKNIKVGIQNNWAPLNYVDKEGNPKGLGVDFIDILNKRLAGILKIYPDNFRNNLQKVKTQEIDAMLDITPTNSRKEFYHFTTPYITIPHAIVTQKSSSVYYKNENMLSNKKVAIEKGYLTAKTLKEIVPNVKIIYYDNTADALDAVSRGKVDAYVGNKAVVNYVMQKDFITNLTFHARTKYEGSILSIGIRKDWIILRNILQKALNSISLDERTSIIKKYIDKKEEKSKKINIAFHFDRPPYMFGKTSSKGIEVDLVKEIFELQGYKINIHQMAKATMEKILQTNPNFDGVASVTDNNDGSFYSDKYSLYEDFVITRKSDNMKIDSMDDLAKYDFVSWKNAYNDLGKIFYNYFNQNDGLYKSRYHDEVSQRDQHKLFFDKKINVIVVDKLIFQWYKFDFNKKEEYTFHKILPIATNSGIKFRDKKTRDIFNEGLKKIKNNGRYKEIVNFYLTQDIRPLLTYSNLIADISGKFIFKDKIKELKNILSTFMNHPDIVHINVFDTVSNTNIISLHNQNSKIISGINSNKHDHLPSIIKEVFYSDMGNPLNVGNLKIYYKKDFKLGKKSLIPALSTFKKFNKNSFNNIEKSYSKFISKKSELNLTEKEQKWIDSNIVKVGIEEWAPVVFSHGGKDFDGISGDILRLIVEKTGLKLEVVNDLWDPLLNKFKNKEIDLLPATYYTDERATYGLYSNGYYKMLDYIYVREDNNKINSMKDLKDKLVAIPKGFGTIPKIQEKYPNIKIIETRDLSDSIQQVLRGEVDALYDGQIAVEYKMQEELIVGLKAIPQKSFSAAPIHFFSHIDKPILRSIINKALKDIPIYEINKIKSRWLLRNQNQSTIEINQNIHKTSFVGLLSNEELLISSIFAFILIFIFFSLYKKGNFLDIRFKLFNLLIILFELSMILFLIYEIIILDRIENRLAKQYENRYLMNQAVNNLRQSSDDLTHFARSYAITKNKKFKEQFYTTLAIRNGEKARPKDYNGMYWNLSQKERMKRHPASEKMSLESIFNKLPLTKQELAMVNKSQKNSDDLVTIEDKAFEAISHGNYQLAIKLLHSKAYYDAKNKIMLPLDYLFTMLDERLNIEITLLNQKISSHFSYILILGIVFIFGNIFLYFLLRKKVNEPIIYLTNVIENIKSNNKVLKKEFYKDEIGDTIEEFFVMHNSIKEQQKNLNELNKNLENMVDEKTSELQKIIESFDNNVIASRSDLQGNITYASKAFAEITGYSIEELMGKPHSAVRHPNSSKELFKNLWETIQSGKIWKGEVQNRKKDGGFYWVDVIITPEFDNSNNIIGYSAIRHDITSKKEVEELSENLERKVEERTSELKVSQQRFELTVAGSGDGLWEYDYIEDNLWWSPRFIEMLGYKENEIEVNLNTYFSHIHKDDVEKQTNAYSEHLKTDCIYDNTYRTIRKDGSYFWTRVRGKTLRDENGKALKTSGSVVDITKLKEAEQEITSSEERFSTLFDSAPDSISIIKDGKYIDCNKKTLEIFGLKNIEELLDLKPSDFSPEYQENGIRSDELAVIKIQEALDTGSAHFEWLHKRFDTDEVFNAEVILAVININNENHVYGVVRDITERKKTELEIKQLHKNTTDSIEYASLIQGALIPEKQLMSNYFSEYLTIWQPKDIVGGDIYLFEELRDQNECLLMVIDCTGHGVPGAFVTMLVKAIERQVISKIENDRSIEVSPAWILSYFNKTMKKLLQQESDDSVSNAGFDGGIIYYNKKENIIKFAGAETPLFYIEEDELKTIKGNRHSIGYKKSDVNYEFKEHIIPVKEGMKFYLSTDGYFDQNGGEKSFPFGKKKFTNILFENHNEQFVDQKEILLDTLQEYQGKEDKNDDVTVIGFSVKSNSDITTIKENNWEL